MTSGAEAYFLAAGQQPAPGPKPVRPELRQCPNCGGRVGVSHNRLETHNQHVVTKTGIREGTEFCDGSGLRIPTTKEN